MRFKMKILIFLTLTLYINEIYAAKEKGKYNILLAVPVASKSIHYLFSSIGYSLSEAGHTVTLFTSFDPIKKHPNMIHFQPQDFSEPLTEFKPKNIFIKKDTSALLHWMVESNRKITKQFWTNGEVLRLYERRNEFDAIITPSYMNEAVFPFLDGYNGTFIVVCTPGVEYYSISRSGHWLPASVVPGILLPYDEYMTFWERASNLLGIFAIQYFLDQIPKYVLTNEIKKYHPHFEDATSYYERSSLTLINGHFALDGPVPLLPNQVEIGTINAQKPKPLPKDLEKFINDSGDAGIIYFSLGSFIMGEEIPSNIKEILVETFRKLPQRVIWKYEGTDLDLPSNVLTRKWLPQQDILGHPKTKIFMSHCGNLGTQEAKFHGVPVLAVPIAFDQPRNAARLERKKYGVIVNWSDMTVDSLLEAVHTLSKDSSYYDRMKKVSKILQDQKDSPGERAVWWVEYVIRHKGAPHLRYAGQDLSFYQYIMLDVIAFWSIILGAIVFAFVYVFKMIWRKCIRSSKTKKE